MAEIAVLIPVLNRPERVLPLVRSITAGEVSVRLVFLVSESDRVERAELSKVETGSMPMQVVVCRWKPGQGDYARKINRGVTLTSEEWVFTAADDLCFCTDWAEEALAVAQAQRKRVIGTNDLGNQRVTAGLHSTHTLVHREYVEGMGTVDGPGLYYEGYWHNYCDDEMINTAKYRNEWAFAPMSWVEHLHPDWGTAPMDSTYVIGKEHFQEDRQLFESRKPLWHGR